MNTDERGSVFICTTNPKIPCKLPRIFLRRLPGAHTSCVPEPDTLGTLEACAPRDDLRVLRVSAVRLFGCGWAAKDFPPQAPGSAHILRARAGHPGHAGSVRSQGRPPRSPRLCGEVFGCGWADSVF